MLTMLQLIDALDMASVRVSIKRKKLSIIGGKSTSTIPTSSTNQFSAVARQQVQQKDKDNRQTNKLGGYLARKRKAWSFREVPLVVLLHDFFFLGHFLVTCLITFYFVTVVSM